MARNRGLEACELAGGNSTAFERALGAVGLGLLRVDAAGATAVRLGRCALGQYADSLGECAPCACTTTCRADGYCTEGAALHITVAPTNGTLAGPWLLQPRARVEAVIDALVAHAYAHGIELPRLAVWRAGNLTLQVQATDAYALAALRAVWQPGVEVQADGESWQATAAGSTADSEPAQEWIAQPQTLAVLAVLAVLVAGIVLVALVMAQRSRRRPAAAVAPYPHIAAAARRAGGATRKPVPPTTVWNPAYISADDFWASDLRPTAHPLYMPMALEEGRGEGEGGRK